MRGITELSTRETLVQLNRARKAAAEFMLATDIMAIRKRMPLLHGTETAEERDAAWKDQMRENLNDILDSMLEEHPEETERLLKCMIVYDEGERELEGIDLIAKAFPEIMSDQVIGFFISFLRSGLMPQGT